MASQNVTLELRRAVSDAVDGMKAALDPVYDAGAYNLDEQYLALVLEVSFKIGMLREVLVNGDVRPEQVDGLWQDAKARRADAIARRKFNHAVLGE